MRALKQARWLSYNAMGKTGGLPLLTRNPKKTLDHPYLPRYLRSPSASRWMSTESRPLQRDNSAATSTDPQYNPSINNQSLPYLEAYNLMEENADVIFDQEKMMNERVYNEKEHCTLNGSNPRPASEIPGPKLWPMVGSLPYMMRHKDFDPKRVYLYWKALREEFGPIFRKDMPGHPNMVFITDPTDIQEMFQSTMYNPVRPGMQSLKKIRGQGGFDGKTNTYHHIFSDKAGILAEQSDEWWRVRRQVQKPVTNVDIIGRYIPQMCDVVDDFMKRIRYIRNGENVMPETFNSEIYRWALESIGTIALERRLGCLDPHLAESSRPKRLVFLIRQLLEAYHETENVKLWQYFPTASIRKLQEAHDIFTEVALEAIRDTEELINSQHKVKELASDQETPGASCPFHHHEGEHYISSEASNESHEGRSLLETLLKQPGLSRGDVLTFLLDMLSTGIDTTSHTTGNMLYLLARHSKEQNRLREEIKRVVPNPREMTQEQLYSLTYAKAVFRETLRMMPVNVGITRKLMHDTVLSGYAVPAGWQVVIPTMLLQHQESVFPRAFEFLPERFLRGSPLAPKHNYGFLPFSFGPRMCIGRRIAYQEVICLITRILTEFDVEYKYEDVQLVNSLSYGPSCPLKFTFTDRK